MIFIAYYFDNAATTKLSPEMKEYLVLALDIFGNPSSTHSEGVKSNTLVESIRQKVQKFVNAEFDDEIIFTSSGSASNSLGVHGYTHKGNIIYSPTAHKSILKTVDGLRDCFGANVSALKVDYAGNIDIDYLSVLLRQAIVTNNKPTLVVVEYANSEIGTVQNIMRISDIVHKYSARLFVDCTGSISTVPLDVLRLNIDMASFSAHKIGALKGVGVLYKKRDIKISSLVYGSQEQGLFGGTENLLGILSLGKAIDLLDYHKTSFNRDFVWSNIKNIDGISLVGAPLEENRLSNNLYCCIKGVKGSDMVAIMDDLYKTQISTGSACNNGSPTPSSTLLAIGMSEQDANSCVRISFCGDETEVELKEFCRNFDSCVKILRN